MPGSLLCDECRNLLPTIDARYACPRCAAPYGYLVCTQCTPGTGGRLTFKDFSFSAARATCSYEGVAKRLITAYKDYNEVRLDSLLAALLCSCVRGQAVLQPATPGEQGASVKRRQEDWALWADALARIPPNPDNLRRRGFDHLGRIAALCADDLQLPLLEALATRRVSDQRALSGKQRALNRSGSFMLARGATELPARILLVDDVFTTGATLNAAAQVLLEGGAHEVRAATIARVW